MIDADELSQNPKTELNPDAWFQSYAPPKLRFWTISCGHFRAFLANLGSGSRAHVTSSQEHYLFFLCLGFEWYDDRDHSASRI